MFNIERQVQDQSDWSYQRLDQTAAALCILAPAVVWIADMIEGRAFDLPRGSISAYHDVMPPGAFFIPLTIAVMIFVMNAFFQPGHRVHAVVGLYLLGVLIFDHDGRTAVLHFLFAGYFFATAAMLDLVRHDENRWTLRQWVVQWLAVPWILLFLNLRDLKTQWPRVLFVLSPFVVLGLAAWAVPDFGNHWLFWAEWGGLTAVVLQYLEHAAEDNHHVDVRNHQHSHATDIA